MFCVGDFIIKVLFIKAKIIDCVVAKFTCIFHSNVLLASFNFLFQSTIK